jgi:hypothetical protein
MPLYHRPTPSAPLVFQKFLNANGCEVVLKPTAEELRRKEEMLAKYRSQATVISAFDAAREVFRPQPQYDFGLNPNPALTTFGVCEGTNIGDALKEFRAFVEGIDRQESQ